MLIQGTYCYIASPPSDIAGAASGSLGPCRKERVEITEKPRNTLPAARGPVGQQAGLLANPPACAEKTRPRPD